jgi:hypothetical protein
MSRLGRPPGHPRSGGRLPGQPNKKTRDLMLLCEEMGLDPFVEMLKCLQDTLPTNERFRMAAEICQYIYPKRKAIEHTTEDGQGFKIVIADYKAKE